MCAHVLQVLGSLATAVLFAPVALTVLADMVVFASALRLLRRRPVPRGHHHHHGPGRIQLRVRAAFRLFVLVLLLVTVGWLFTMLSWLRFPALEYAHVAVNAALGPLFVCTCVLDQAHVRRLLGAACCPQPAGRSHRSPHADPYDLEDCWGDEMTAIN